MTAVLSPRPLRIDPSQTPARSSMPEPPPARSPGHRPHVVVLGAGVCGLYAARTLAARDVAVTVLERDEVVGGLAAGRERGGNFYDFGVHHLHAFDAEIFDDLRDLMAERMISVPKLALIRYGKGYRRYPLEFFDLLTGIPPWTLAWSMAGLLAQQLVNRLRPQAAESAEDALIQLYGRPLYGYFFRDFTHRYWGIHPRELSAAFVRKKMPRLSAVDVIKKALGKLGMASKDDAVESATKEEQLYYSRTGARELPLTLAETVVRLGGRVLTSSPVVGLELEPETQTRAPSALNGARQNGAPSGESGGSVSTSTVTAQADGTAAQASIDGQDPSPNDEASMEVDLVLERALGGLPDSLSDEPRSAESAEPPPAATAPPIRASAVHYVDPEGRRRRLDCDAVLSTIPLPELIAACGPMAPEGVHAAAGALRHKPVAIYGFLLKRPQVLNALYVYYRNRIFHRLAEPALSGMTVQPEGHTVLLAETTCEIGDDRWSGGEATIREMVADLEAEGLLSAADIVETHVFTNAHGYPVFALGFEPHLAAVEAFLARLGNLRSTGRQGGFCYPNMHGAMRMGATAATELIALLVGAGF